MISIEQNQYEGFSMQAIYLFKVFLWLCATLFAVNIIELIQANIYSFETLTQVAFFSLAFWLSLNIHSPKSKSANSALRKAKFRAEYKISNSP